MEIVNGCSDMHDIPILSQLKEFKAIFLWKIFPYHRNFSPKLIKVPVLLFDTLEYLVVCFQKAFRIFLLCELDQKCSGIRILMVRWGLLFSTFDCLNCASIVMFALSRPFVIMYNLLRGSKAYRG